MVKCFPPPPVSYYSTHLTSRAAIGNSEGNADQSLGTQSSMYVSRPPDPDPTVDLDLEGLVDPPTAAVETSATMWRRPCVIRSVKYNHKGMILTSRDKYGPDDPGL